jgi:hypothetical protein
MPNGNDLPVYQEWDHVLIQTTYSPDVYYRVFLGTVDWERNGNLRIAYTVFYQHGDNPAFGGPHIVWREPAHIVPEDLDRVIDALQTLRQRHHHRVED